MTRRRLLVPFLAPQISMAIGFLFLGGGALSFGTDNEAVAALVVALFPRLPDSTTDQRPHLQAFRHLYALAARKRVLKARARREGKRW